MAAAGILLVPWAGQAKASTPVPLALEIDNGEGKPIDLAKGRTYYLDTLDIRAAIGAYADEGVDGLKFQGDFRNLDWRGVSKAEQEFVLLANADGTYTRRAFYRNAAWMNQNGFIMLDQVDARGRVTGEGAVLLTGDSGSRSITDAFFIRRMRAIQWTYDCPTATDCTGARSFEEEALVELRNATTLVGASQTFKLHPQTAAIRVTWSQNLLRPYFVPIRQIDKPAYAYGFQIGVQAITPARKDGTYAAGTDVSFRVTLRDGEGKALHAPGTLPSYMDTVLNEDPAGIRYYTAFFDPTTTYYRRKHRERMLMAQIIGPAQRIQPIRSILALEDFLQPGTQNPGQLPRDGVYSEVQTLPQGSDLFGGAFDPTAYGWTVPVSDIVTFHVPADAPAGTYFVTLKGRRVYMGEDIPATTNVQIQIGTPVVTQANLGVGNCQTCHTNGGELSKVLHGNTNVAACAGCHAPLSFELEGPIAVRLHFIHSRSGRLNTSVQNCSTCHTSVASIQRTSKAACLSCHTSYPAWHETQFGKIESMYVGGGAESFANCTTSCHTNHPGSRL
ncbi:hypothetical protein AKJ08_2001 [Vulgatibacter incomptus]|uniref:Uncharacterized protein n=2 Tax=Vulgatibacter incomptus TaxID=1391653 RepID=A0A0K1PER6_9BACT|nr:hypothetical protein AKJ08_2001 [Vulgatibacter incomptus]